jgi:hypothetical protein
MNARLNMIGTMIFAALALASPSLAQDAIEVEATGELAFGGVVGTPSGGTVVIAPDGTRTASGVYEYGTGFGAATFLVRVSGKGNPHYSITLPSSVVLTNRGGSTMTIDSFQSDPAGTGTAKPPSRSEVISVGGTLRVSGDQPPGDYQGTFYVTVNLAN